MKRFKQFIMEEPLPLDVDPLALDADEGKFNFRTAQSTHKKAKEIGAKEMGVGSSRIAFLLNVESTQFQPGVLKKAGIKAEGKIPTIFKLARDARGIMQNQREIKHNSNIKSKYILPILDTSYENRKRHISVNGQEVPKSESNWIQYPLAYVTNNEDEFEKYFIKEFGPVKVILEDEGYDFDYDYNFHIFHDDYLLLSVLPRFLEEGYFDPEREANWKELFRVIKKLKLSVGDLTSPENWGLINGRPIIIDYGFDDKTLDLYTFEKEATATVDAQGNISIKLKKI